jgi:hypothetical protein
MSSDVPGGSTSSDQDTTVSQSEVDILNQDTDTSKDEDTVVSGDEDETKEEETETKEEETEDEDLGIEEEEEELEDLDESQEPTRPSWQLIKEKYPDLAKSKDFRELYFRDKAYTDIYPTVNDAKEASNKAEQLDAIDATLVDGNVDALFENINSDVLSKISDRILPALYKHNQAAFARAARPLIVNVLRTVSAKADKDGDDNLRKSVRNVSRALTGSPDLPNVDTRPDPTVEAERNRLQQERQALYARDNRNFVTSCDKTVMKRLESMVADGLDPRNELNDFTRQSVVERTLNDLHKAMVSDEGLKNKLQQTHKLAARAGFPEEYRARIVSASLERAKKLIPMLRDKHYKAARGKQSSTSGTTKKIVSKTETVTSGGNSSTSRGKIDTNRTNAEDFLNDRNVVYRK